MSDEQQQSSIDPNRVGCRIVDVHNALQTAFNKFAESSSAESTLDDLAIRIRDELSVMPAFLIGDLQDPPAVQPETPQVTLEK